MFRHVLLLILCAVFSSTHAFGRKPNVIVILTDDQGSIDTNLYGREGPRHAAYGRLGTKGCSIYAVLLRSSRLFPIPSSPAHRSK